MIRAPGSTSLLYRQRRCLYHHTILVPEMNRLVHMNHNYNGHQQQRPLNQLISSIVTVRCSSICSTRMFIDRTSINDGTNIYIHRHHHSSIVTPIPNTNGPARRWYTGRSEKSNPVVDVTSNTHPTGNHNNHKFSDLVTMSIDSLGICTIVLNRPQKLNALNIPMFVQLQSILHSILQQQNNPSTVLSSSSSPRIRVILVRGEGRAFCTGLDIPSIVQDMNYLQPNSIFDTLLKRHSLPEYIAHAQNHTLPPPSPPPASMETTQITSGDINQVESNVGTVDPQQEERNNDGKDDEEMPDMKDAVQAIARTTNLAQDIAYLWRQIHVPVIGCVHGMCYGGGLQMVLGMDIRYVQSSTTKISIMESKWGLIPDMGASITLRELIAIDTAKELTFTGRVITGEEALRLGLVTKCVDDPIQEGYELAKSLVEKSPDVLRYSKQLYQQTYNTGRSEEECLQLENHYQNQLLCSYNQIVASLRTKFGWKFLPYWTTSSSSSTPPTPVSRK